MQSAIHIRYAALQSLCNKEFALKEYKEKYPQTDKDKTTHEMRNGGCLVTVTGFNFCQLVFLRDLCFINDTLAPYCANTVEVHKTMLLWPMNMGFKRYDDRYGDPLGHVQTIRTALSIDINSIRIKELNSCGVDLAIGLEGLGNYIVDARNEVGRRMSEVWKAESVVKQLEQAQAFLDVRGVNPDAREPKRARH